jgi:hypothetical protein
MREVISLNGMCWLRRAALDWTPVHAVHQPDQSFTDTYLYSRPGWLPNRQFLLGGMIDSGLQASHDNGSLDGKRLTEPRCSCTASSMAFKSALSHLNFLDCLTNITFSLTDTSLKSARPPIQTRGSVPSSPRLVGAQSATTETRQELTPLHYRQWQICPSYHLLRSRAQCCG